MSFAGRWSVGASVALMVAVLVATVQSGKVPPGATLAPVRVCTVNDYDVQICKSLSAAFASVDGGKGLSIECVPRASMSKCMYDVGQGTLDVVYTDSRNVYSSNKHYGLLPLVGFLSAEGLTAEQPFTWASIAVLRKGQNPEINSIASLKGKRSCHTAVGRNMAWALPLSLLRTQGLLNGAQDCLDNVENAAKFFQQSCAPGSQNTFYNSLNQPIDNLCKSCASPPPLYCTEQDLYANYSGDFKCLTDGKGDVAFSTQSMIFRLTDNATEEGRRLQDLELLCLDGSRKPVSEYKTCNLGWFGNDGLMLSSKRSANLQVIREAFLGLEARVKPNGIDLFRTDNSIFGNESYGFVDPKSNEPSILLGPDMIRMMTNQTLDCSADVPSVMRWCTISPQEAEKCDRMATAFLSAFIKPAVECVAAASTEACMAKIQRGEADLLNVDGGDIYTAGKAYGLKPIMYEDYGTKDSTYFSVAVAKTSDPSVSFNNLKGRQSCHTGVGRTAGWNVPIAELIKDGQINLGPKGDKCRHLVPVSQFFNESCAPGAEDDASQSKVDNLCALCKGQGKDFCSRSDKEPYFGYVGALRCLVEGGGDVAFINHLTVGENVDGKNTADWAKNLKASDFQLLCKDGTRQPIDKAAQCNLARVPSHAIVTAGSKTQKQVNAFIQALNKAAAFFVSSSINFGDDFILYGPGEANAPKDIIFRDGTQSLVPLAADQQNYVTYLGTYITTAEFMDCPKAA